MLPNPLKARREVEAHNRTVSRLYEDFLTEFDPKSEREIERHREIDNKLADRGMLNSGEYNYLHRKRSRSSSTAAGIGS